MNKLAREISRLHANETNFDEFCTATSRDLQKLAEYLLRRWKTPVGVERVDVEQELRLALWSAIPSWDPTLGLGLERYATWTAVTAAKRWIHQQRNSLRRDDKALGRFPVAESACGSADDDSIIDAVAVDARQEDVAYLSEQLAEKLVALEEHDQMILRALVVAGGSVEHATRSLFESTEGRAMFRRRMRERRPGDHRNLQGEARIRAFVEMTVHKVLANASQEDEDDRNGGGQGSGAGIRLASRGPECGRQLSPALQARRGGDDRREGEAARGGDEKSYAA